MESWVIGTKFIILLYSIICYVKGDMIQIPLVILSILAYVCFSMLHYIFKSKIIKRSMLFLTCIFLTLSAFLINPIFIFLLPISMMELAASYTEDLKVWALFAVLPVAFCDVSGLPEYFLTAGLSFTLYMLSARMYAYISTLKEDNEKLKVKNEALLGRLDVGVEYENQLKYLTQMEERNSLAQKIHDKVGHTIAGSLIQLEAAIF
jgi:signal transduction histidine kinase